MKILFICRGNIGRSQFAEALFKKYVKGGYEVFSAGVALSGPEQPLHEIPGIENVLNSLEDEGIDISQNYRNQLTKEIFNKADKVVLVIDDNDPIPEYVKNSDKVTRWNVLNPKGMDFEFHKKTRDQIKEFILSTQF